MNSPGKELTPAEAAQAVLDQVRALPAERVALPAAAGRILRQPVHAERDNPPFDRVCMDGAAISSAAFARGARRFRIEATQAAGAPPLTLSGDDAAIESMTGAILPSGTDCVVPVEDYRVADGFIELTAEAAASPGRNVQLRGAEGGTGEQMLAVGTWLGGAELAIAASAGLAEVAVSRQPRISVISTGDELVEPGLPIAGHQIRRSNAHAVAALLRLRGFAEVKDEHVRDERAALRARIGAHLDERDVLVLSGGVSKGKFDFVPSTLQDLGVQKIFHHVAQRPGRPLWFGVGPRGQLVFGLPGNPVSTLVCLRRYVLPALWSAMGRTMRPVERLALSEDSPARKLTFFMPVTLESGASATLGRPRPPQGSGDFLALAGTAGFVELPPRPEGYERGYVADFYRW